MAAKKVLFRKDTKCPYCLHDSFVDVVDRRPNQDLVQCADETCERYFVILKGSMSYPLLDPADVTSPPGTFTIIDV